MPLSYAVSFSNVEHRGSNHMTQGINEQSGTTSRRLKRKFISSRYAAKMFCSKSDATFPMMPRFNNENADSTVLVWISPST